jgi:hypothetical protein
MLERALKGAASAVYFTDESTFRFQLLAYR